MADAAHLVREFRDSLKAVAESEEKLAHYQNEIEDLKVQIKLFKGDQNEIDDFNAEINLFRGDCAAVALVLQQKRKEVEDRFHAIQDARRATIMELEDVDAVNPLLNKGYDGVFEVPRDVANRQLITQTLTSKGVAHTVI